MKDVEAIMATIDENTRRADARALVEILSRATGEEPRAWGDIIGFGRYHFRYESGREGDSFLAGLAPRRDRFSIHLMGIYLPDVAKRCEALLARLGKYKAGKACIYVRRLQDVDQEVLRQLAEASATGLRERYPTA